MSKLRQRDLKQLVLLCKTKSCLLYLKYVVQTTALHCLPYRTPNWQEISKTTQQGTLNSRFPGVSQNLLLHSGFRVLRREVFIALLEVTIWPIHVPSWKCWSHSKMFNHQLRQLNVRKLIQREVRRALTCSTFIGEWTDMGGTAVAESKWVSIY